MLTLCINICKYAFFSQKCRWIHIKLSKPKSLNNFSAMFHCHYTVTLYQVWSNTPAHTHRWFGAQRCFVLVSSYPAISNFCHFWHVILYSISICFTYTSAVTPLCSCHCSRQFALAVFLNSSVRKIKSGQSRSPHFYHRAGGIAHDTHSPTWIHSTITCFILTWPEQNFVNEPGGENFQT